MKIYPHREGLQTKQGSFYTSTFLPNLAIFVLRVKKAEMGHSWKILEMEIPTSPTDLIECEMRSATCGECNNIKNTNSP